MTQPLLFIAFYALASAALFLFGLRVSRMTEPPAGVTLAQAKRFGRLAMMAAAALFAFLVALWFHGDLKGVAR